jgi:asparagine synthase (glutamine-hydrolysing)
MCGIAGYFHADPERPIDPRVLVAMAAIQHHRGPDGFGYQIVPGRGVGFSHARLSIIDLDERRARQPFLSPDGALLLAHNGEFYDYKRLRADLTARGARFRTRSDSELVMHLYPRLGMDAALAQLRGEFAFALYDRGHDGRTERLMLVRDRFGIKPLYWTQVGGTLVFGSEIKVLFAHPEVPRALDHRALYHQLMQTMVPGTTAFAGVHQVQPGHVLVVERRGGAVEVRSAPYWDMDFPRQGEREVAGDDHYIDGVRERLVEAVQLRLEADVPVACYLSGGIDSCSILGISAACQQSPVKAFTIGFDDADYDESDIARSMAAEVGAEQEVLMVDGGALYQQFGRALWHAERSIYNTFAVAKLLMSERVHQRDHKVVVTGEGSDELFAGYPSFRQDMFLHGLASASRSERAALEEELRQSNELFAGAHIAPREVRDPALEALIGFTPSCLQPWLALADRVPALLHPDIREDLRGYGPGQGIAAALDGSMLDGRHPLDKAQYVWIKTQFESQVLGWAGDRMDMANSLEARPAFLDHPLAEFALSLPPRMRIRGTTEKYVLREAMRGLLPRQLYEREKFAFMAPPAQREWSVVEALVAEHLSGPALAASGVFDAAGVAALLAQCGHSAMDQATQVQLDALLNHLLSVQHLYRRFVAADVPRQAARKAEELGWRP